jgi:hypothetical protein
MRVAQCDRDGQRNERIVMMCFDLQSRCGLRSVVTLADVSSLDYLKPLAILGTICVCLFQGRTGAKFPEMPSLIHLGRRACEKSRQNGGPCPPSTRSEDLLNHIHSNQGPQRHLIRRPEDKVPRSTILQLDLILYASYQASIIRNIIT